MFNLLGSILGSKRKEPSPSDESSEDGSEGGSSEGWAPDEDPAPAEDDVVEEEPIIPFSSPTLAQMLTKVLPDADVRCPRVVIVGGQSSGKTKMIINLVFHYLIDNSSFTDKMGEKLLRIFRTGSKMVTRRPTTVQFRKKGDSSVPMTAGRSSTPVPESVPVEEAGVSPESCDITISLGDDHADLRLDEAAFDAIVTRVTQESTVRDGRAFGGEFKVVIAAPGLPNMSFTDLPGLITDDRILSDAHEDSTVFNSQTQPLQQEQHTIRKMVRRYMEMKNTTLVVVEPASVEDFETSQVSPLLREIKDSGRRRDIFNHAVLVLSKCDKIRQGFEQRIMSMINLTSSQIGPGAEFPYKHVVGVINKVEDPSLPLTNDDVIMETFAAFKEDFKKTKAEERERFQEFRNSDGSPCDAGTHCTTSAVFNRMDRISFEMVQTSLINGEDSLKSKIDHLEECIRRKIAPPLWYYEEKSKKAQAALSIPQQMPVSSYTMLMDEVQHNLEALLIDNIRNMHPFESVSRQQQLMNTHSSSSIHPTRYEFIVSAIGKEWVDFKLADMQVSMHQYDALLAMKSYFNKFIDDVVAVACVRCLTSPADGCFSSRHSPFHRIDRFPRFCEKMKALLNAALPECRREAKDKVSSFMSDAWNYRVPQGVDKESFVALFDQFYHVAVRQMFHKVVRTVKAPNVRNEVLHNVEKQGTFDESEEFAKLREKLMSKWSHLHEQLDVLRKCMGVTTNEELRDALDETVHLASSQYDAECGEYATTSNTTDTKLKDYLKEKLMKFWEDAEKVALENVTNKNGQLKRGVDSTTTCEGSSMKHQTKHKKRREQEVDGSVHSADINSTEMIIPMSCDDVATIEDKQLISHASESDINNQNPPNFLSTIKSEKDEGPGSECDRPTQCLFYLHGVGVEEMKSDVSPGEKKIRENHDVEIIDLT